MITSIHENIHLCSHACLRAQSHRLTLTTWPPFAPWSRVANTFLRHGPALLYILTWGAPMYGFPFLATLPEALPDYHQRYGVNQKPVLEAGATSAAVVARSHGGYRDEHPNSSTSFGHSWDVHQVSKVYTHSHISDCMIISSYSKQRKHQIHIGQDDAGTQQEKSQASKTKVPQPRANKKLATSIATVAANQTTTVFCSYH